MEEHSLIVNVLVQFNKKKSKGGLFNKKGNQNLQALSEMITNPLKQNLKSDILTRAGKIASQVSLSEAVVKIITHLKKINYTLEDFVAFNNSYYNKYNKRTHNERVLLYATYIAIGERVSNEDLKIITDAAKLHDLGRVNNLTEPLHGQKSVSLIKKHNLVEKEKAQLNIMYAIIDAHSAYDKNIEAILNKYEIPLNQYSRVRKLCYILKDAEALDKVRFFEESTITEEKILKPHLLKTLSAKQLVTAAFELVDFYSKNA